MTKPALEVLPAAAWAERVAAELADRLRAEPALRLCLPTGETPNPLYDALAALAEAGGVSFEHATLVMLDEYVGLPEGDPARCDSQLRARLIDHLDPPPAAFIGINVDGHPAEPAVAELDAVAAEGFDIALVGLGLNGHIGMNEPPSDATSPTRLVPLDEPTRRVAVERYGASREPACGITIGLDRLLAAREIWLLVTGERKAEMLARTLEGPETPDVPASCLRRHPRLRVLADEEAASRLGRR